MTSCFVYKVMGLTFHIRISTKFIYKIEIAQVVTRRIIKPQRTFCRFKSHRLLFFIHFFLFFLFGGGGRGRSDFIILFMSFFFSFYIFFYYYFFFIFYPFNVYKVHI